MADDRSNPKNYLGPYADADRDWLALRAAERPAYLASALAEYLEIREWTPEQLAERLHCTPQQLAKLGLCRRPELSSAEFHEQVSQIATYFEIDYWGLRRLLEELEFESEDQQMRWVTEESFDRPGHRRASNHRAAANFTRMFEAPAAASGEGFLGDVRHSQASEQGDGVDIPPAEPAQAASGVTLPRAAAPQKSWLKRLLGAIRGFFLRK